MPEGCPKCASMEVRRMTSVAGLSDVMRRTGQNGTEACDDGWVCLYCANVFADGQHPAWLSEVAGPEVSGTQ